VSLRWRIALGFALVALATAAVIALAAPPIISQGFSDYDSDNDGGQPPVGVVSTAAAGQTAAVGSVQTLSTVPAPPPANNPRAQQDTVLRLLLAAIAAAAFASLFGLIGAGRLVRPLTRLEQAAGSVARGNLASRSGLAERSDEFGQLGRTFDSMAGELQAADESRRRFLQDAAHELKTPLAVIDATSSAILDGVYTPERRHLETIRDQSRVLARIVDDLRTISLAEGGHLPLERQTLDVRTLLDSVAAGFEARAAASSITFSVEAPDGLTVEADPDRLRQVIGALVDNALRHTPESGSVRMAAAVSTHGGGLAGRAGAARPIVRLAVEDTGPGIPPESLPRIFERFYQADPSRSRGTGTSGLGLSIVQALAEAHGWRVGAENRVEGGARLWIELPAVRTA
jgi:two-component system sensor histidine kinase BaeS